MGGNTSSMQAGVVWKGEEVEATRADVKSRQMESGLPGIVAWRLNGLFAKCGAD